MRSKRQRGATDRCIATFARRSRRSIFEVRLQTYFHPVEFEANPPTRIWRVQNAYPKNQNKVQKKIVVQPPFRVPYQRRAATRPPQATIFFLTRGTEICRLVKFQLQWMQPTKVTVDSSCHFLKLFGSLPIFHFFIIPVFTKYMSVFYKKKRAFSFFRKMLFFHAVSFILWTPVQGNGARIYRLRVRAH